MSSHNTFKSASIFVSGLSNAMTESKLFQLFNKIGAVSSVRICRDSLTKRCLGYGYVNYYRINDAEKAIKRMNFEYIAGKQCRVMWYQQNHCKYLKQFLNANIFVKNLDLSIDDKILYETFSVFGEILSCKIGRNKITQKSLGYGYINFVDSKCAHNAINQVNGLKIFNNDKPIIAEKFKSKNKRINELNFTNIYVKYIPKSFDKTSLKKLFEQETNGKITSLSFWRNEIGISACLNFENTNYAQMAINKLNGKEIDGNKLYVVRAQKRKQRKQHLKNQFIKQNRRNKRNQRYNNYFRITQQTQQQQQQPQQAVVPQQYNQTAIIPQQYNQPSIIQQQPQQQHQVIAAQQYNEAAIVEQQQLAYYQPIYPLQSVAMPTIYQSQQQPMIYQSQPQISIGGNNIVTQKCMYHSQPIQLQSQPIQLQSQPKMPTPSAPMMELEAITMDILSSLPNESQRKRLIGERLFSQIQSIEPRLAPKLTGMLLEIDNDQLLMLLNDHKKLFEKVNEALIVLKQYQKQKSISNSISSAQN